MKAIIPVAGKGVRLLPHTVSRQKALLPVGGKAVLDYVLEPLIANGVNEFAMVIGHLGAQIRQHMAAYDSVTVTYHEQIRQRGLGDAVLLGLADRDEPALIVLPDTIFEMDYAGLISGSGNHIGVVEVDNPQDFGVVELLGRRVVDLEEKPAEPVSNLVIAGIYRIESQRRLRVALQSIIDNHATTKGEFQLTDGLKMMLEGGANIRTVEIERWLDCGTPENLLHTNEYLLRRYPENVFIHPTARVKGATVRNATIMDGCEVVDSILDNCIVLPGASIINSSVRGEIIKSSAQLKGYVTGG
ncbi:MAG: NTP transferase domain-containing protein [Candidatus Marinimicrobia bacterium]|nr:NTP transferase domain-containing protein [Candidatus Neomarinimicrobiota bacterium]